MAKNPGKGTQLKHGVGTGPTVYTAITQRTSIKGPGTQVGKADVTDLDSIVKEYRPTLGDPGEMSFDIWYDPVAATHQLLTDYLSAPAVAKWQLKFSDDAATAIPFDGFVSGFEPGGMDPEGYLMASVKIQVVGNIPYPS